MSKTTLYSGAVALWLSGFILWVTNDHSIGHEYMAAGLAVFWIGYSIKD